MKSRCTISSDYNKDLRGFKSFKWKTVDLMCSCQKIGLLCLKVAGKSLRPLEGSVFFCFWFNGPFSEKSINSRLDEDSSWSILVINRSLANWKTN